MSVPEPKTTRWLPAVAVRAEVHGWDVAHLHGNPGASTQQSMPDLGLVHGCGRFVVVKAFPSDRVRKIARGVESALSDHQRRILDSFARSGAEVLILAPTVEGDVQLTEALACDCDTPEGENDAQNAGEDGFRGWGDPMNGFVGPDGQRWPFTHDESVVEEPEFSATAPARDQHTQEVR